MIYNLVEYVKSQFPTEKVYCNLYQELNTQNYLPDRLILLREAGGTEIPWIRSKNLETQCIVRDFDSPKARELAYDILNLITSRFGLVLPAVTVDGIVYPAIPAAQITAVQLPHCAGVDTEGRTTFISNYRVLYT